MVCKPGRPERFVDKIVLQYTVGESLITSSQKATSYRFKRLIGPGHSQRNRDLSR